MKTVYLDDYNLSDSTISFIKAYQSIFDEELCLKPDSMMITEIRKYFVNIPNELLQILQNENLMDYDFRTHSSDYPSKISSYNEGIYNLLILLLYIDRLKEKDEDILILLNSDENTIDSVLLEKMDYSNSISLGIFSFCMALAFKKDSFVYDKRYMPAPGIGFILKEDRLFQAYKEYLEKIDYNKELYLGDFKLLLNLVRINRENNISKLLLSLLFIHKSDFIKEEIRDLAYILLNILCELTFCCRLHGLYIQARNFELTKEVENRGSDDATTRISLFFSASNEDIFCLRIDLPHAGEECFHLNLQELRDGKMVNIAFPIYNIEYYKFIDKNNNYSEFFYDIFDYKYFKTRFKEKVKSSNINNQEKEKLYNLFDQKCHKEIRYMCDEKTIYKFTEVWKDFILSMNIEKCEFIGYGKDEIDYNLIAKQVRSYFCFEKYLDSELSKGLNAIQAINVKNLYNAIKNKFGSIIPDVEISDTIDLWSFLNSLA